MVASSPYSFNSEEQPLSPIVHEGGRPQVRFEAIAIEMLNIAANRTAAVQRVAELFYVPPNCEGIIRSMFQLLVTANVFLRLLILFTLVMVTIRSS
jgi:hypothetical protein